MQEKYQGKIKIKEGIEFGVQMQTIPEFEYDFQKYKFDFVILNF